MIALDATTDDRTAERFTATGLAWEAAGTGDPILLIHAGVADRRMWLPQVAALAPRFQLIRYDLRGLGRSKLTADPFANHDDAIAVLDAAGVARAHVIGISYGGTVALATALAHPERVHSLVIGASTPPGLIEKGDLAASFEQIDSLIDAGDIDGANELEMQLWVDGPHRPPTAVDPALRAMVAAMNRPSLAADWSIATERELDPPIAGRLHEITQPTLILAGELDQPHAIAGPRRLAELIPHAEFQMLPGVAHMLNLEQPEQFNAAIEDFLSRHPIGQPGR